MASLQISCLLLPTNHRRGHRLHLSCSGGSVDRRNLLLGLGGLYGAANLNANGAPIQPPDLKTCTLPDIQGETLDVNCCPPLPMDGVRDYELPAVGHRPHRVRPAVHRLSREHIAKYEEAIRRMRELDKTDPSDPRGFMQQANVHCAYCNNAYDQDGFKDAPISVHFSWIFFPWHRWYLYFYERILGKLIGDPHFALPFWNWDNPKGMQFPEIFDNPHSPLYDTNRDPLHRHPAVVDLVGLTNNTDPDAVVRSNLSKMYKEMIGGVRTTEDFMGKPYCAGMPPPPPTSGGLVEVGSHTHVHRWVGNPKNTHHEDLGSLYSAGRDPAFYSHHANVDRMWALWKNLRTPVRKDIHNTDYLNASFLFYDENKELVRVKVADALDHRRMGYEYERMPTPWMCYRPLKSSSRVKIQDISKGAEKAGSINFPIKLTGILRVLVPKATPGDADEVLVLEDVETNPREFVKFDVYVNDEDDEPTAVDKAEFAGTFAQLPHTGHHPHVGKGSINMSLKELYEDIDIDDGDDEVVVTIVPRANGGHVTIGGIKIVAASAAD